MADNKPITEVEDAVDPVAAQLRRLELERPDALLRQRVLVDVDAVLNRPDSSRPGFRPVLAMAILAGSLFLLLWVPRNEPDPRPEIPATYVEETAHWLDLSPELARHVVRPTGSSVTSHSTPALERKLRHATHAAINL